MSPDYSNIYSDVKDREPHTSILKTIGPGSKTKESLVRQFGDEYGEKDVKLALLELYEEGQVVEHTELEDCYVIPDG